ncbi:unnamed protein product [Brachionus calyciflorus]|uniref:JmjC domain-containing protein n=1 Tax=Brachionus calyciflorus TaxID=104777 RepID=A0A813UNB2_9BILA|nr:unnamed protein product [Brachionus calyciflorus]
MTPGDKDINDGNFERKIIAVDFMDIEQVYQIPEAYEFISNKDDCQYKVLQILNDDFKEIVSHEIAFKNKFSKNVLESLVKKTDEVLNKTKFNGNDFKTYENIDNVEHVIFDVRTLSLREKISDNYIFKQVLSLWSKKKVLVAKNAYYANGRDSPKWNLDEFSKKLGTNTAQIIDFTKKKKEQRTDTLQNFFSDFTKAGNVLKFSEWAKITTLKEASLELYNDYCAILPCKQFTSPTGNMNLIANLPVDCCPPDIGPKIFAGSKDSYTNLHIDISDAVNILFYANELEKDKKESLKEFLLKSNCDKLYIERLESETPGAIWHIFSDSDVPVISKYLNGAKFRTKKRSKEINPIHSVNYYLDDRMIDELSKINVKPIIVIQFVGDAVLVPSGFPHQVKNLNHCIKLATDFISPYSFKNCLKTSKEFAAERIEDKLQLKNVLLHTIKRILYSLEMNSEKGLLCDFNFTSKILENFDQQIFLQSSVIDAYWTSLIRNKEKNNTLLLPYSIGEGVFSDSLPNFDLDDISRFNLKKFDLFISAFMTEDHWCFIYANKLKKNFYFFDPFVSDDQWKSEEFCDKIKTYFEKFTLKLIYQLLNQTSVCQPCTSECSTRCGHSKCAKKCSEPCLNSCEHFKCNKKCFELCDRAPCNEPCSLLLPCDHKCIGLCGEPCPKRCRTCHPFEKSEIFFGNEQDENARFILLVDCNHNIEVEAMDKWINDNYGLESKLETKLDDVKNEVQRPVCPICRTVITLSKRYSNQIKSIMSTIEKIKLKYHGSVFENKETRNDLVRQFTHLKNLPFYSKENNKLVDLFLDQLGKKYNCPSKYTLTKISNTFQVYARLLEIKYCKYSIEVNNLANENELIDYELLVCINQLYSNNSLQLINHGQQMNDINNE